MTEPGKGVSKLCSVWECYSEKIVEDSLGGQIVPDTRGSNIIHLLTFKQVDVHTRRPATDFP